MAAPRTRATTRTIWLSLGAVAVVGAAASYRQALGVVQAADGRTFVSWCVAGLADPTILAASVNIIDAHRQGDRLPRWSILSIVVAVVVTLGMNVAAGSPHDMPKWLVSVWPPVAFLLALESLMSYLRRGRGASSPIAPDGAPAAPGQDEPAEPPTTDEALRALLATGSRRRLAEVLGVPKSRVDNWANRAAAPAAPTDAPGAPDPNPPGAPRPPQSAMNGHGSAS